MNFLSLSCASLSVSTISMVTGWLLPDVSFANRNGYDFRINAQGSRGDLWVSSVTVGK